MGKNNRSDDRKIRTRVQSGVSYNFGVQSDIGAADDRRRRQPALFINNAANGAFRAGEVTGAQWTSANRGAQSVAFGRNNTASGAQSVVGGGDGNTASGIGSFVGAGSSNVASGNYSVVCCGSSNTASGLSSFIGGGNANVASNAGSVVFGGGTLTGGNTASGVDAVVVAGRQNQCTSESGFIGAGINNLVQTGINACVLAGTNNIASGDNSFVGGGQGNTASGASSWIGGGNTNVASGTNSSIVGGANNTASGLNSVACGSLNTVSGANSFICGVGNTMSGTNGFCGGRAATNNFNNSFVWNDGAAALASTVANSMSWGCTGGARLTSNNINSLGVQLAAGGSAWAAICDRAMKENLVELDYSVVESKVETLPIFEYNYIGNDPSMVCIGPMAQDWAVEFPSSKDPLTIETLDLDGIGLAAAKSLIVKTDSMFERIAALKIAISAM